ncbi:MAG TPA: aminotransferase class IV [candidate division Zixibacteria bacterium]
MSHDESPVSSDYLPVVYFDGSFVDIASARIPVTTHALHYGTGVFEGIRSYGDGDRAWIFRARDHYERLLRNAALLQMVPRHTVDESIGLTVELLRRNDACADTYIRPLLYNNTEHIGAGLNSDCALTIMAVRSARAPAPRAPLRTDFSRWRRFPSASCPAGAKITGLYINSSLARGDAQARGYDQPILLTTAGQVSEGFGANLFAVFGRRIVTPPPEADILAGITRRTLLDHLARMPDYRVSEEHIDPDALTSADELFFCGTGMEITPIGSIGDVPIGDGAVGPVTTRLAIWYRAVVTHEVVPDSSLYTAVHRD